MDWAGLSKLLSKWVGAVWTGRSNDCWADEQATTNLRGHDE